MLSQIINFFVDRSGKDLMTFCNKHLWDCRYALVDKNVFPGVCNKEGICFYHDTDNITCRESYTQYNLDGLRRSDIVIDLGANVGAFSFRAYRAGAKRIYAYEPIKYNALYHNIELNRMQDRIRPSYYGVGPGTPIEVTWNGQTERIFTKHIRAIIQECGGCDFLKCDVEGAEWYIDPSDLQGVRRIELEFHTTHPLYREDKIKDYENYFKVLDTHREGKTLWYSYLNKYYEKSHSCIMECI